MNIVTVIVPVYNVEKYIGKCIESILNQTYVSLQVILVNDGSTDNSGFICDSYKEKDPRINVIHQENGGLSSARNIALRNAIGEYIICVDSDDYIHPKMVEILLYALKKNQSDISVCNIFEVNDDEDKPFQDINEDIKYYNFDVEDALKEMLVQGKFDVSACGKLYKSELFNNIKYPEGKLYEDLGTTYKLVAKSKKITYVNENMYANLQRKGSLTRNTFKKKYLEIFEMFYSFYQFVEANYPKIINYAKYREALCAGNILNRLLLDDYYDIKLIQNMRRIIRNNMHSFFFCKQIYFRRKLKLLLMAYFLWLYKLVLHSFKFAKKLLNKRCY